jgi:hypothetical protein
MALSTPSPDQIAKWLAKAKRSAARVPVEQALTDIVVLLQQLRTIEHMQDRALIAEIRKRYGQEDF